MNMAALAHTRENWIAVELYFRDHNAKAFFNLLLDEREEIESIIDNEVVWKELPTKRACRIITYLEKSDPLDESKWPEYFTWMQTRLEEFYKAFNPRVKTLDPDDYQPDEDEE